MASDNPNLSSIPLMAPPPGVISNFNDPPTRSGSMIAAGAVCLFLASVFVLLRLYARLALLRIFGVADYLLLTGYAFAVVNTALAIATAHLGFGRHGWDVPLINMFPHMRKLLWWQMMTYVMSLCLTKVAILCQYPKISPSRTFRKCVWVLVAIVVGLSLSSILWTIIDCLPIKNYWDLETVASGKCLVAISFIAYTGASNILTDFAILILPMVMLRNVQLPKKKKIGIAIVFATGPFASLISVVRVAIAAKTISNADPSWANVDVVIWSFSELSAGVICACLPTLRPLAHIVRHVFPTLMRTSVDENSALRRASRPDINTSNRIPSQTSWVIDRVTLAKGGQPDRDDTSEEYILSDRIVVSTEYDVIVERAQNASEKKVDIF
ncbi:hypothetical protein BKA66DRAFT_575868 [Pyrenochaeta sp. MPI-SDFR-AT-0127]|nr:hypothetical protein BKA66DRAFT_575868 [Pyrenochaeta sp. MPI-SDFR-AT-0127]